MPPRKARDAVPNPLLRQARVERGWTQSIVSRTGSFGGAAQVSRWERGLTKPNLEHQQELCRIFGKNAAELGFVDDLEQSSDLRITYEKPLHPLRRYRIARGWTQQYVASYIGVHVIKLSRWERGMSLPDVEFRQHLCLLFDMEPEQLHLLKLDKSSQSELKRRRVRRER